jgi:hypothetical protein
LAADRTLIQIRERSFLDVLDLTMVVVRARPWQLGLAAVAGMAPFVAFNTWVIANAEIPFILLVYLLLIEVPWATAPLTVVLGGMMFGERRTVGQVVLTILRGLPAMILYQFFLRGVLMLTGIFYLVMPSKLAFLNEVVLLEKGRFWGTLKRCETLAGQGGGYALAQWFGQVGFGALFLACFLFGTSAIQSSLTSSELTWETPDISTASSLKTQFALWLIIAFFSVTRFLSYIDQRIRLEGWEVKIRLQSVGQVVEQGGRW